MGIWASCSGVGCCCCGDGAMVDDVCVTLNVQDGDQKKNVSDGGDKIFYRLSRDIVI